MRADMAKVIVERPRIQYYPERKGRLRALEDMPSYEGMRRAHAKGISRKELNENLKPLYRYLARQVGRPWSKVYSEISANLCADSAVQQHVRDHIVGVTAPMVEAKPKRNISGQSRRNGLWEAEFYVDPRNGLLCRTDKLPEEKAERRAGQNAPKPPVERIALSDEREFRKLNGIWYEVQMAALPKPVYEVFRENKKIFLESWHLYIPNYKHRDDARFVEYEMNARRLTSPPVRDVVTGKLIAAGPQLDDEESWKKYRREQPEQRCAVAKRVLNRRELRRHGLSNQALN